MRLGRVDDARASFELAQKLVSITGYDFRLKDLETLPREVYGES